MEQYFWLPLTRTDSPGHIGIFHPTHEKNGALLNRAHWVNFWGKKWEVPEIGCSCKEFQGHLEWAMLRLIKDVFIWEHGLRGPARDSIQLSGRLAFWLGFCGLRRHDTI